MARLWDLWPFVKKHVYHPQFQGSFSLKAVLPGLAPGFSYEGMEVSHGDEAGLAQRGPANDLTILGHLTTRRQDIFTAPVQPAQLATRVLCYRHPQTQRAPHSRSHISQCPSHMNPASNAGLVRISQPRIGGSSGCSSHPAASAFQSMASARNQCSRSDPMGRPLSSHNWYASVAISFSVGLTICCMARLAMPASAS